MIRKLSKKRASQNRVYLKKRKEFLTEKIDNGEVCPVTNGILSEIHHINGRIGDLLLDERYWLAVSMEGHAWIHDFPNEARKKGWIK